MGVATSSLMQKGEVLSNVKTQEEAIRSLDNFISKSSAKFLISHGAVDIETFDSLLQRNPEIESPNYLRMKKVYSQKYFRQFLTKVSFVCLLIVSLGREALSLNSGLPP